MYRNVEIVLNFGWIMAIENDKNTLLIHIIIWLYLINRKRIGINNIGFWQNIII
jgi:hypothetical protein